MLRDTWYYNKEIKVENTLTNIPLMKGTVPKRLDICYDFGTFNNILHFYFHVILHTFFCESIHPRINVNKNSHAHMFAYHPQIISHTCNVYFCYKLIFMKN